MAKRVTEADIIQMNEAYLGCKSYSGVAKVTGWSASTVKKYIIPDYEEVEEQNITRYSGDLPEFDSDSFRNIDWSHICELSEEERKEMETIWKEIEL